MKPAPSDTAELVHRVRQQLILAQVRIMELEDVRDDSAGQLNEINELLIAAQVLVDQKTDEAAHLTKVREELQAQFEHMRHMQHVTNEALNLSRQQLENNSRDRTRLEGEAALLNGQVTQLNSQIVELSRHLAGSRHKITVHEEAISRVETELSKIKATRSWRWTSWLRSADRTFRGKS